MLYGRNGKSAHDEFVYIFILVSVMFMDSTWTESVATSCWISEVNVLAMSRYNFLSKYCV